MSTNAWRQLQNVLILIILVIVVGVIGVVVFKAADQLAMRMVETLETITRR